MMAHDGRVFVWSLPEPTSAVPYEHAARLQHALGHAHPTPSLSPLSSLSSSTSTTPAAPTPTPTPTTLPAQAPTGATRERHWHHAEPQFVYDTRYRVPCPLPFLTTPMSMPGPHVPSTLTLPLPAPSSPAAAAPAPAAAPPNPSLPPPPPLSPSYTISTSIADALLSSLHALHTQYATLQGSTGAVASDVQEALSQLHALRASQGKTDKRIAELEGALGVRSMAKPRRTRRGAKAQAEEAAQDTASEDTTQGKTMVERLALIQAAMEELLVWRRSVHDPSPLLWSGPSGQAMTLQSSDSSTPPSPIVPEKEYADASIQACPPSPSDSSSVSYSHNVPAFTPVDWTVHPAIGRPASHPVQPTAYTAEYFARFMQDTHPGPATQGGPNDLPRSATQSSAPTTSSSLSPPSEPVPTASSPHAADVPAPPSLPTRIEQCSPLTSLAPSSRTSPSPLTSLGTSNDTQTPRSTGSGHATRAEVSRTSVLATLSSLTSLSGSEDASVAHAGPVPRTESRDAEDTRTIANTDNDDSTTNISISPTTRQPSPSEEDTTSSLPTPPSETQHTADSDPKRILPMVGLSLPMILTPPCWTPEPSVGPGVRGMGVAGSGSVVGSVSPLTPPLLTPSTVTVGLVANEGSGEGTEEAGHTQDAEHANARSHLQPDPPSDPKTRAQPAKTTMDAPVTVDEDAREPLPGDELFVTPRSSADPDPRSPSPSKDGNANAGFSSPWRRFLATATPSRYTTPSGSDDRPTREEDEVLHLVRDASGVSTPVPASVPLSDDATLLPNEAAQTTMLTVDPSVLHAHAGPSSPPVSGRSLTLLEGTNIEPARVDKDGAARRRKKPRTSAPADGSRIKDNTHDRTARRSEPYRTPLQPDAAVVRSASKMTNARVSVNGRSVGGGPGASLDELALLARRRPLKICLRVPEGLRGAKRKRAEGEGVWGGSATPTPQDPPESAASASIAGGAGEHPEIVASHKRTRKQGDGQPQRRPRRTKKPTYHVRNGQVVTIAPRSQPEQRPESGTSSVSQLSVVHPDSEAGRDQEQEGVPTPTRVRHRKGGENAAIKTPSSSTLRRVRFAKTSPTKEDVWDAIAEGGGMWPVLPSVFSQWEAQFIECDNCDKWFHYGCVGVLPGDPRLEPGAMFICPTCHNQSARRLTMRNQDDTCARPDCPEPQVTSESELYFVEKLVGRKKTEGYVYMWLAKWEGYPMSQATWIPKENVVGDETRLINAFLEDAVEEGANLSGDVVLLREAVEAGWEEGS